MLLSTDGLPTGLGPMTDIMLASSVLGSLRHTLATGGRSVAAMTRLRMQRAIFDESVALIEEIIQFIPWDAKPSRLDFSTIPVVRRSLRAHKLKPKIKVLQGALPN